MCVKKDCTDIKIWIGNKERDRKSKNSIFPDRYILGDNVTI